MAIAEKPISDAADQPSPAFLARVSLFASLGADDLAELARETTTVHLEPGDFLFHRGDQADALYLVDSGHLEAVIDEGLPTEQVLSVFGPSDFCGEMALLSGGQRSASLRARKASRLFMLSCSRFDALAARRPEIGLRLSQVLSRRLSETDERMSSRRHRLSVLVGSGSHGLSASLLVALANSLGRQLREPALLVLLGGPGLPLGASRAIESEVELVGLPDVRPLPGGQASVLHVADSLLSAVSDAALAEVLAGLHQHYGHVLAWAGADLGAAVRVATLMRADLAMALALFPSHGGAADLARLGEALVALLPDRSADLTFLDVPGARPPAFAPSRRPAIRLVADLAEARWADPTSLDPAALSPRLRGGLDRLARVLAGSRVGLALSGGAAQGVAHLGVMEAFVRAGVPIDLIAGTSGGSLYGSMVASGMPVREAQHAVVRNTRNNLFDRADFTIPRMGVIRGERIARMVRDTIGDVTFDDLTIPLYAVATDLDCGEEVVLSEGPVYQAVRASISVPGLFEPCRFNGRTLVDGGVVNPLPVSVARCMGADYVIAVQVPAPGKAAKGEERQVSRQLSGNHNLLSTVVRSYYFAGDVLASIGAAEADVLVKPPVAGFGWRDYRSAPDIILAGLRAGREAVSRVADVLPVAFEAALP